MKINHKIVSTALFSLPLIQEGQSSVPGERMCTSTGCPLREFKSVQEKCGKVN